MKSPRPGLDIDPDALLGTGPLGLLRGASGRFVGLRLLQYVLLFAAGLVLSRALGPEGRSQYAVPLALAGIVQLTFHFSLEYATGRMLARGEADLAAVGRFLSLAAAVLGALGFVTCAGLGLLVREELLAGASTTAVVIAAATVPVGLAGLFSGGLLLRLGDLRGYGGTSLGAAGVQFAGMTILAAVDKLTPESALGMTVLGFTAIAVGMSARLIHHAGWRALLPEFRSAVALPALSTGLALHPAALGLFLNLRVDLLIVSSLLSARETGLYSLAVSLAEFVFLAAFTLSQAAIGTQTREDEQFAAHFTRRFAQRSVMIGLLLALGTAAVAYPAVLVLYGEQWTPSVKPLVILTFAAVALTVEAPTRTHLMRVMRPSRLVIPAAAGLLLNVAANFLLIPILGIGGAALASLISYTVFGVVTIVLFRQATGLSPLGRGPLGLSEP